MATRVGHLRRAGWCLAGALVIGGVLAGSAAAAPTSVLGQYWAIALNDRGHGLGAALSTDCVAPEAGALAPSDATKPFAHTTLLAGPADHVSGTYDAESRAGGVTSRGPALWLAGSWSGRSDGRLYQPRVTIADLGLELQSGRAYVTGTLGFGKTRGARAPVRRRLALIAHTTLASSPATQHGVKVSQSLLFSIAGNATLQPALANALNRIRCPHGSLYPHSRRVRAGSALGQVRVTMIPGTVVGTAGMVALFPDQLMRCGGDCATVSVTPTGAATVGTEGELRFPLADGTSVPLTCDLAAKCVSQAGRVALVGGFSLGLAGAASNATDLSFAYSGIYNGAPASGESTEFDGLLDGGPAVLSVNQTLPPDTMAHLTAVLGGPLKGAIGAPDEPFFTSLRLP